MKIAKESYVNINLNKPENLVLEDLIKPELPFFILIRRDDGTSGHQMTTGKKIIKHIPAIYYFVHVLLERQHSDVNALRCWFAKDFVEMFSRDIEPLKSKNYFRFIWGILRGLQAIEFHDDTKPNKYKKTAKAYYFKFSERFSNAKVIQHQILIKKTIAEKLNKRWSSVQNNIFDEVDISSVTTNKQLAHQYKALRSIKFDSGGARQHADKLLAEKVINIKQYNTFLISINN